MMHKIIGAIYYLNSLDADDVTPLLVALAVLCLIGALWG